MENKATNHRLHCLWGLSLLLSYVVQPICTTSHVYIVYLGVKPYHDPVLTSKSHLQLLSNVFTSKNEAEDSLVYSYKHAFSGFSARLNSTQATTLANMKQVMSVFRSRTLTLHTTRSWDFLGLTLGKSKESLTGHHLPLQLTYGTDIIVGVLDSGIWPEYESFKEGPNSLGPVPLTWKGQCVKGDAFEPKTACNRKLIGARYYLKGFEKQYGPLNTSQNFEYRSPRDFLGHGTHTASTAAGSIVRNTSFFGFGEGTARGGAPRARIAVYKICWTQYGLCSEADTLAAFDDALHDGVHVISASFGGPPPLSPFFASSSDIGSFHAMQLGVSVVFSAGNDGPESSTVGNVAPWSICVAASSIDRSFPTQIILNGNFSIMGESFIDKEIKGRLVDASIYFANGICAKEQWMKKPATGRIILCFSTRGPISASGIAQEAVMKAGGIGLIFVEAPTKQIPEVDIMPIVRIAFSHGTKIVDYIAQFRRFPLAQILPGETVIGKSAAPVVASFSSRGPSSISPSVLKPDLSAPGINILAAWPSKTPPTSFSGDERSVYWNFLSGTSMACPHVSGVVALLKSAHPDWSPGAIISALITTAYTKDTTTDTIIVSGSQKVSDPFDIGAGHLNPLQAMDPGLVYEMKSRDFILFLCKLGYTEDQISSLMDAEYINKGSSSYVSCSQYRHINVANINYPSITVTSMESMTLTIKRTVRNVSMKKSAIYIASVVEPEGVEVVIWPRILIFTCLKEELTYFVTLKAMKVLSEGRYTYGEVVWFDGIHKVRSPLVVSASRTTTTTTTTTTTNAAASQW